MTKAPRGAVLEWHVPARSTATQTDDRRATEDGAEAIALTLVSMAHQWVVARRLQQGEFGDWLLHDADGQDVALEVSGIADDFEGSRLREKLRQVRGAEASVRAACVLAFGPPKVVLEIVGGR